jgi:hypothetical protein
MLLARAEHMLAWRDDLRLPLTNNQVERGLCPGAVQQKMAGTSGCTIGAPPVCRIPSSLSTLQKQGHSMLFALAAVFHGHPFPIAWDLNSYPKRKA